jgi:hypothetical protein
LLATPYPAAGCASAFKMRRNRVGETVKLKTEIAGKDCFRGINIQMTFRVQYRPCPFLSLSLPVPWSRARGTAPSSLRRIILAAPKAGSLCDRRKTSNRKTESKREGIGNEI